MKKVMLIAALAALAAMTSSTFADVQNIRLSGDVRVRGYYLKNANGVSGVLAGFNGDINKRDNAWIQQRTRVKIEADLEDHVLVVVTLKADGVWGSQDLVESGINPNKRDRTWSVGISEAYIQLNELFYSPATLKIGRQYLNYGHGLILSSVDQTYNFDAGRLVLDFYPFTIDLVGAKLADNAGFGPQLTKLSPLGQEGHGGNDLLFVNARYEAKDSILKNVEAYFGWAARASSGPGINLADFTPPGYGVGMPLYSPTAQQASPWIVGLRGDLAPIKGLQVWFEGAYEGGQGPTGLTGTERNLSAFLANVGAKYTFTDVKFQPSVNVNYTYASGGGTEGVNNNTAFVPFFDTVEGYNGYLFQPSLSNIHILNLGASIKPSKNTSVAVQGYYYLKADNDTYAGSNQYIDAGGLTSLSQYQIDKRELGAEVDGIFGYDYSKDVRFQLIYAAFIPGRAFSAASLAGDPGVDRVAHMVRGEVNVKF